MRVIATVCLGRCRDMSTTFALPTPVKSATPPLRTLLATLAIEREMKQARQAV